MRESIGGAWILGIVMTFIVLFASFLAISINYAKAFKVKNNVVDLIEKNEGMTDNAVSDIYGYLQSQGYILICLRSQNTSTVTFLCSYSL